MSYLSFGYTKTAYNYIRSYKEGAWQKGTLTKEDRLTIPSMATALHYGQEAFEGLKAFRRQDGRVQIFRPYENAKRFQGSCQYLLMPTIEIEDFVEAVYETVKANLEYVPAYDSGGALYIRPYMLGVGETLAPVPSQEYLFGVIVTPVSSLYKGSLKPVNLWVSEYDRVAPLGTGQFKIGGNYAASLFAQNVAKSKGYDDALFLDPLTHTKIEEVGAANFFGITKDHVYITPESPSVLKSITNKSLRVIVKDILGLTISNGDIYIDHLEDLAEAGACGTAAVITPIRSLSHKNEVHVFPTQDETGPITKKLYDILTAIQKGDVEDFKDWTLLVE